MARWYPSLPLIVLTAVLASCGAQEPGELPVPDEPAPEEQEASSDRGSEELEELEAVDPAPEEQAMESEQPRQVFPDEQGSARPEQGEEPGEDDRAVASGLEGEIDLAIEDASSATGESREDISVVSAERVTWNDGSLGCPDADGMYTQALVEGYRIILSVDGRERAYHGQDGQEPFYCANPQQRSGGGTVDR